MTELNESDGDDTPFTVNDVSFANLDTDALDEWEQLASKISANFSLYPGWMRISARSQKQENQTRIRLVRDEGNLRAVLPTICRPSKKYGLTLRTLELVSNLMSYHNQAISTLSAKFTVASLLHSAKSAGANAIHLAAIPDESELGQYLAANAQTADYFSHRLAGERSPFLHLGDSWETLVASKSKKFRYKLRKRAEGLAQSDDLAMRWYSDPDSCTELLAEMKIIEEKSWKKDAGLSIFDRPHEARYHQELLPFLAKRKAMFANVLFYQDRPIAYNLCCNWENWVGQLKTSFDMSFSDVSPGSTVIDHAIKHAIDIGAQEFDFLGDKDPHKLAWSTSVRPHSDYFLYLKSNLTGFLLGAIKKLKSGTGVTTK